MSLFLLLSALFVFTVESFSPLMRCSHSLRIPRLSASNFDPNSSGGTEGAAADQRGERTFASYVIYKSKTAVSIKAFPATFEVVNNKARVVSREGGLFLEFANSSGPREYDWSRKGNFLMSATECGELLMMDASHKGLDFFHDPNMGSQTAGQVTKRVKFAPAPDGKGLFLSLAINDKSTGGGTYSAPVSWGELQVRFFFRGDAVDGSWPNDLFTSPTHAPPPARR